MILDLFKSWKSEFSCEGILTRQFAVSPENMVLIGSCFTKTMCSWLLNRGLNNPQSSYPWDSFYNSFSLEREITRLFAPDRFQFEPIFWTDKESPNGTFADPFRSWLESPTLESLIISNQKVDESAYNYTARAESILVVFGLCEVWSYKDRREFVFNKPPTGMIKAGELRRLSSRIASVQEVVESIDRSIDCLRTRFAHKMPIFLALSPVPIKYTASDYLIEAANTLSKATLRVAIDFACKQHENVIYVPVFEIVDRLRDRGVVFQSDARTMTTWAVDEMMLQLFAV